MVLLLFFLVPIIAMSLQTFPSDVTLYEDTYIDLICDPTIPEAVDTEVSISFTWTGPDGGEIIDTGGQGAYTITGETDSSTLRIEQLMLSRDNMAVYSCLVSVTPRSGSAYIVGSESNMADITLTVACTLHVNNRYSNVY